MIGHRPLYQPQAPLLDRFEGGQQRELLRSAAIQTVGRVTGCCYPEGSLDALLDWMSDNAELIWRQADRPTFGGSGDLRVMLEALRVSSSG